MSGFMDALEHFFSSKEAEPTKPRTEAPAAAQAPTPAPVAPAMPAPGNGVPPGWSPAPVQADNKVPYLMPSGWNAVGQPPPVNTQWQAESAPTSVPAGWAIANQNAAQQAALQQALAQKFGK